MNEIAYIVSFNAMDKFNNTNSGHSAVVLEKGNYTEGELLDFFVESVRTNLNFKKKKLHQKMSCLRALEH